ncbi:KR domain-containing protein, partial [Cellulomonas sp. GbtcB1]
LFARRLVRAPRGGDGTASAGLPTRGTVLITAGTHGPGAHLARRLAGAGAEHLLLTVAPEAPSDTTEHLVAELHASGTR